MRLIFLDIDGVLNSVKSAVSLGGYPHSRYPVRDSTSIEDLIVKPEYIDPVPAGLINKLAYSTDSFIVISSTWRIGHTLPQTANTIAALGIDRELIVGQTDSNGKIRGDEIQRFIVGLSTSDGVKSLCEQGLLEKSFAGCTELNLEAYVIIDDSRDMTKLQLRRHFVKTSNMEGLSFKDTIKAGKILTGDRKFDINKLLKRKRQS